MRHDASRRPAPMSVPPITPAAAGLRVQIMSEAEARLLAALDIAAAGVDGPDAASPPPKPAAQADPVRAAAAQARTEAAGRQASLAPLFADLAMVAEHPDLPPPLKAAVAQVLALQLPAPALSAETVRQALGQSGLFLEAKLAVAPPDQEPPADLKAALLTLQRALGATPRPGPGRKAPSVPPPLREAALAGQRPAAPSLPRDADPPTTAAHLAGQVEQVLARQMLHQLASLPDGAAPSWLFEIPLATPQGTAVAQFEIEADAKSDSADPAARAWRARFSLDVEPLGPVHVQLSLAHGRTTAAFWAEREAGLERLRVGGEALARDLSGEVAFHAGAPARPSPAAGRFVDRAS